MYFSNRIEFEAKRNTSVSGKIKKLEDSLAVSKDLLERADYFSLNQNLNARNYFGDQDADEIAIKVRDGLYKLNNNEKGNPLINYPSINNAPFRINKIKVLNNRWVIADFTDGKMWGELIIKYFIEDNGEVSYETVETLVHSHSIY
jgi:hypothetical protein